MHLRGIRSAAKRAFAPSFHLSLEGGAGFGKPALTSTFLHARLFSIATRGKHSGSLRILSSVPSQFARFSVSAGSNPGGVSQTEAEEEAQAAKEKAILNRRWPRMPLNPRASNFRRMKEGESPVEFAKSIDTTLTPEQKEYVEMLKKKMGRGPNSKPSPYRDVPRPEDLKSTGNFTPLLAENAEELIDWALSHIPKRDGPRRSRRKKRMEAKFKMIREQHAVRKVQMAAAHQRKLDRRKRITLECKAMRLEAKRINEARELARSQT